ncbi:DinB family protein [Actinoplanes sp. NPDC026619]|uniref:DinB family protein n=1 Tax=Actinoplanes sp. NPDC026619 TaxID=3155798 RepID=UPI0033FE61E1
MPAPNGIHFHPPISLWVDANEHLTNPLTEQLVRHDLDDTDALLTYAKGRTEAELNKVRLPGAVVLDWDGPEETIGDVLHHLVRTKETWLASIGGRDTPPAAPRPSIAELVERHEVAAAAWLAVVRDLEARGGWNDRLIDALCEPLLPRRLDLRLLETARNAAFVAARYEVTRRSA